ncbi:hypothetical protein DDE18_17460 [Nocardioides gansuensis]|uniref:Methyltransferase type 11 domain-containing protein n=1 Tax=Nocardioides gansuensis TaxID=2138300 RepID=A0A2T8F7R4_9ACTN|nr:methyltransferase domain-containing protein [Nocardioides gansuensis]PVG81756.1 hypothetical protein DDE18_17460 [Nocardioides gansuensis]
MDADAVKRAQVEFYEAGHYDALAATLLPAAQQLVEVAAVAPGQRVLDVAAGDGNIAEIVVRRGGAAAACDISHLQVCRMLARVPGAVGIVADVEALPFPDAMYDAVLSAFGAVAAPDPDQAVAELFRVCRPGGTVALTAWPDGGFMAELAAALRARVPAPESFPDQDLGWGDAENARARFARHAPHVQVERHSLIIDPAVRGKHGPDDFAARYAAERFTGIDLAEVRADLAHRHTDTDGRLRADYLVVAGQRG